MTNTKKRLFVDMDGTIAEWHQDGKFTEPGYYKNLLPYKEVVFSLKLLMAMGVEVFILSAAIDSRCRGEKRQWLSKFLPEIDEHHILFSQDGGSKVEFVESRLEKITRNDFLLDDYGKNLSEWAEKGTVIKMYNGVNGQGKSYYAHSVKADTEAFDTTLFLSGLLTA